MSKMISECPACGAKLRITSLRCADCGMELRNDFELSPFDSLNQEQKDFLIAFLKQRGNMSSVQNELGISYLTAKKRLDDLLEALNLVDENQKKTEYEGAIDMSTWYVQKDSNKASDIIKRKLMENGGRVVVRLMKGSPCEIIATPDGESFVTDKIQNKKLPYRYEVFDVIVNLLPRADKPEKEMQDINSANLNVMKLRLPVQSAITISMQRPESRFMIRCSCLRQS